MTAMMVANPKEMESVVVHEKVPKEVATVKTSGALKKRRRDRHLVIGFH
jgi:hypothetical protein